MLLSDAIIADQARQAGLVVKNNHAFGQDYAVTCATWATRLDEKADKIRKLGYGEEFMRNWRYYLSVCAASFAASQTDVVQVELTHA